MISEIYIFKFSQCNKNCTPRMVFVLLKNQGRFFFARFSIGWNKIVDKIKFDHLEILNAFGNLFKNGHFQN